MVNGPYIAVKVRGFEVLHRSFPSQMVVNRVRVHSRIGVNRDAKGHVPGPPKEPKRMAQHLQKESIGSIGSIILAILEVQVDTRILHSGLGPEAKKIPETMVCRLFTLMWFWAPLSGGTRRCNRPHRPRRRTHGTWSGCHVGVSQYRPQVGSH